MKFFKILFLIACFLHAGAYSSSAEPRLQITLSTSPSAVTIRYKANSGAVRKARLFSVQRSIAERAFVTIARRKPSTRGIVRDRLPSSSSFVRYRAKLSYRTRRSDVSRVVIAIPDATDGSTQSEFPAGMTPCPVAYERELLERVNAYRAQLPATGLRQSRSLDLAARVHSLTMATNSSLGHDDWFPEILRSGYDPDWAGQNVAYFGPNIEALLGAWLGSAGHRANIESPRALDTGISCIEDAAGRLWWTQNFAHPAS